MSNLSRTASLFSTAVLGGMLLTTSINSVATIAYAAETTAVTSISNDTTTDAIITVEVLLESSDSMDRFFNATAKLAVKGTTTDVTISFKDSVANILAMIPEITFDGITLPVNGQQAITFTIPTDNLRPTSGSKVTLSSFTSVPMSPSKGYKSNLTFDLSSLLPSSPLTNGSYDLPISADNKMDTWFDKSFSTKIGWLTSQVTVSYQESKQAILGMIPSLTFDNITKSVNGQRMITFDIPTKDLNPDANGIAKIASFTSVPMSPSKGYASTLSFNMTSAMGESGATNPVVPEVPTTPTQPDNPSESNPEKPSQTALTNGVYSVPLTNYKTGTTTASSMNNYLKTPAMMGQNPIRFNDSKHAAKLMSTNLVNGYYQSVFRLTLSASEIASPILTNIHVQFTSPLVYNENYEIRLVIGDQLSGDASVNNQNNDQTQNEITDTVIVPRETEATTTTFDPAPVAFTAAASSVPMAATPLATTRLVASPQTVVTPQIARLMSPKAKSQQLIGSTALWGSLLLLNADTIARTILVPKELSTSAVLLAISGPLFVLMLIRGGRHAYI